MGLGEKIISLDNIASDRSYIIYGKRVGNARLDMPSNNNNTDFRFLYFSTFRFLLGTSCMLVVECSLAWPDSLRAGAYR